MRSGIASRKVGNKKLWPGEGEVGSRWRAGKLGRGSFDVRMGGGWRLLHY